MNQSWPNNLPKTPKPQKNLSKSIFFFTFQGGWNAKESELVIKTQESKLDWAFSVHHKA